ncbi:MAG: nucleoside hydrolase [Bacteroidales bacterium]|nr:nucleoside hydrolase [Bacteroidales bacterium]
MKRFLSIFLVSLLSLNLYSHPWKPSHYVIVDTDGGIDDMRAITMLLASPDVRVLAITVSPGALSAENAYIKVKSLLNSFYHEGIPVGINRSSNYKSPEYPVALQTFWGEEKGVSAIDAPDYLKMIGGILSAEKTKISFICLGSMSTAFLALQNIPDFRQHVKEFIWSADGSGYTGGFNYNIDKNAPTGILKQEILVKVVRKYELNNTEFYNEELIRTITALNNKYSKRISALFDTDIAKNHKFSFEGTDEMSALFLHFPDLFINKTAGNITDCTPSDLTGLRNGVVRILKGETASRNQVMRELPVDPSFYFEDISPSVKEIIDKYGIDEWTSGVLANELHRHLGVFAIIGVKMGIRAREYFNTGVDEFYAISFAGSIPPLSCMNDGLQVSTELKEINFIYGLDSNIYRELVRKNSIKYWLNLDRHEIFVIEEIQ